MSIHAMNYTTQIDLFRALFVYVFFGKSMSTILFLVKGDYLVQAKTMMVFEDTV